MITRKTDNISAKDFSLGEVILIDKNSGQSSFYAVKKIRGITRVKKVGHAGTLDPNATGLLIICTGKMTKEIYKYQDAVKKYSGTITLGKRTESMDSESDVIEEKDFSYVTGEMLKETANKFLGKIEQVPPMYSALKYKGKSLYKYARKGIEVERKPRSVEVFGFNIISFNPPEATFDLTCSKGTYVRVIADDLGRELGCGAYLSSLRREKIGEYFVDDSLTVEEFEKLYKTGSI